MRRGNKLLNLMENTLVNLIKSHNILEEGDRVLAAVSGGPDSVCMLHVLKELSILLNLELFVFHLDHQVRGEESREDAEFVKAMAERMEIPSFIYSFDVPRYRRITGLSLQEAARRVRLRLMARTAEKIKASKAALGHNSDDQVETILMRMIRGSGPEGLTGMSMVNKFPVSGDSGTLIIRPLLEISRNQIEMYCRENNLSYRRDPSNERTLYQRNKIRLELIPHLQQHYNPQIKEALLNMSRSLDRENRFMEEQAHLVFLQLMLEESTGRIILEGSRLTKLHPALQSRIFRMALSRIKGNLRAVEYKHIESIYRLLHEGGPHASLSLPGGIIVQKRYQQLQFLRGLKKITKRIRDKVLVQVPGITRVPELELVLQAEVLEKKKLPWPPDSEREAYLDYDQIKFPLFLSLRWPGARFRPLGLIGSKKVKDFLIDEKVPREERDKIPLILSGENILWVVGKRISHPYRVTEKTRRVLVLKKI